MKSDLERAREVSRGAPARVIGPAPTPQVQTSGEHPVATDVKVASMPASPRERADLRSGKRGRP